LDYDICRDRNQNIMYRIIYLAIPALLLSSCVPQKKYAALKAENESLQSSMQANTSVQRAKNEEIDMAHQEIQQMHQQVEQQETKMREMEELLSMMNEEGKAPDPEQLRIMEERRIQEREMERMKMEQSGQNMELENALGQNLMQLRFQKSALKSALSAYTGSKVEIIENPSMIIVSVKNSMLFTEGTSNISASGETFLNRFSGALSTKNDLGFSIDGISGGSNADDLMSAGTKANALAAKLNAFGSVKKSFDAVTARACEDSKSGKVTSCDRTEFVFEIDYESVINAMQPASFR